MDCYILYEVVGYLVFWMFKVGVLDFKKDFFYEEVWRYIEEGWVLIWDIYKENLCCY